MGIDASSSDYISSDNRYRTGGQFFPFGVKSLMGSSFETNLGLHMMKCRHVPEDIRNALEELHRLADEHGVSTKRGSKTICMEIIWDRLSNFYPPVHQADTTEVISEERVDDYSESMKQDILSNHDSAPQADTTVATSEERQDDYSESMKQDILSNHDPAPQADTTVATSEERRDDYSDNKIRQQKPKQRHHITSCFPTEAGVKRQRRIIDEIIDNDCPGGNVGEKRQREMVDNRCCKVQTKIAAAL